MPLPQRLPAPDRLKEAAAWPPHRLEQADRVTRKLRALVAARPFAAGIVEISIDRLLGRSRVGAPADQCSRAALAVEQLVEQYPGAAPVLAPALQALLDRGEAA
ncbi:MAG TPA: hypothetical protein VM364_04685 [Vicinamibacterales bacterium]|nr:hypothetical protein [Vicinamibacterales bacterium]